jgi:ribosome maturation factor RimP
LSLEHEIENKIKELAAEVCEREGFVLYDVDYGATKKVVSIFIDKEGGVNLDDCAKVSSGLNFALDVEDLITKAYNLEVSSPGLERHLKQKWHFEKQIEKQINVVIKARTETSKSLGAKNLKGVLKKVEDEVFVLESDQGKSFELPYEDIHKCNVVFEF